LKWRKNILVLLNLLWFCGYGFAQDEAKKPPENQEKPEIEEKVVTGTSTRMVFSLDQVVEKTLETSPLITSSQYSLEEAQALYEKAKRSSFLPKIDMRVYGGVVPDTPANAGPAFGFPSTGLFEQSDWGPFVKFHLEGFQPIYTFGKIKNLQDAAKTGTLAKELDIIKVKNEMVQQAKKAYYTLANLHAYLDFVQDLTDRSQKTVDIVSERLKKHSSDVTDIDLMRVEVFLAESKRKKIEILYNIDFLKMTLKILMGLPRHFDIDIVDHKIRMEEKKIHVVEHFLQNAKEHRPEVKQLQYLIDAKESFMKEKRAQMLPSFGLAGEYDFGYAPGREDIDNPFLVNNFNNHSAGGTLVLQQNLALHTLESDYKKAKAEVEKAKSDQQAAYQAIEFEIRNMHKDVMAKEEAFEHSKDAFKKVRSWVLSTTLNFGVGVVPPKDLVEAFVAYSKVQNEYLQTQYEYMLALIKLDYATGYGDDLFIN